MTYFCATCGHAEGAGGQCPNDGTPLTSAHRHDLLGRMVGDYRILARLGGGAYGTVYRAAHTATNKLVALKLLAHPIDHADGQRVVIEARAASMIAHPNCVEVFDMALTADRRPYIVMQLLDGAPLSTILRDRITVAEALTLIGDVLRGLTAAHARGVIHRDLKPGNIFVADGRAVIVDFGFAKLIADPESPNLSLTGEMIGTPAYMAPEQIRAHRTIDPRVDIYAAGCLLYEMLANRPPFPHKHTLAVLKAHLEQQPAPLATLRPDVPPHVASAVSRALAKHPDDRFATAAAMLEAVTAPYRRGGGMVFALCLIAFVVVIAIARC